MKRKLFILFCLTILPILLYVLEIIVYHSKGDFFLYTNYDGPYGLLLASLNIAQLKSPGFFQHPGIIPLIISSIVINVNHFLQGNNPDIVLDVIDRPEFYLYQLNLTFTFLSMSALFILGVVAYRKIGNIFAAIFIQLTPFISFLIIYIISHNILETTTLILILILISICISFLNEQILTSKKNLHYVLLFGFICGLALANKISILPILIIPFLLIKNIRFKTLFILTTISVFTILFLLVSSLKYYFFKSLFDNVFSSGITYNSGPSNYADPSQIIIQLNRIFNNYLLFFFVYLLTTFTLLLSFIPKFKNKIRNNKYFLFLLGIFFFMSAFIIIEIKSHLLYYIMPGLLFSIIGLFAINSIFMELFPFAFKRNKYIYIYLLFLILMFPQFSSFKSSVSSYAFHKKESYRMQNYIDKNYKNAIVITTNFVTSLPTAFYQGLPFAGNEDKFYYSILKEKYPNSLYFQRWSKKFLYINNDLVKNLDSSDTIVYLSFDEQSFNDFKKKFVELTNKPNTTFEELLKNGNGERLYLVKIKE